MYIIDDRHRKKSIIIDLLQQESAQSVRAISSILAQENRHIGQYLVEFEQKGDEKAEHGNKLLDKLSKDLTLAYGRRFSHLNLIYIRKFHLAFPKSQTPSHQLSWRHFVETL
ncbi:MAG: DUF1016 N-terminal domain-containing protein [Sphingobacterium sp.]